MSDDFFGIKHVKEGSYFEFENNDGKKSEIWVQKVCWAGPTLTVSGWSTLEGDPTYYTIKSTPLDSSLSCASEDCDGNQKNVK